jgi:hypothetical protein
MAWWCRLGLTPNLSTRALWQPPLAPGGPVIRGMSEAIGRMDEGNEYLVYTSPWDFRRSLRCRKILRHGTSGFTSHPKEGVLRIFIALKNPSPSPGSNPRPLGPVASTLTITPPRLLCVCVCVCVCVLICVLSSWKSFCSIFVKLSISWHLFKVGHFIKVKQFKKYFVVRPNSVCKYWSCLSDIRHNRWPRSCGN